MVFAKIIGLWVLEFRTMVDREMQELLWHHPERFLNEPMEQIAWECSSDVGRADLVFEDRHGKLLIVEVKHGRLPRGAVNQLLDYFGVMKERFPNKPVELMVVANSIPSERRLSCESRDIECREISEKRFRDVAAEVSYSFASETTTSRDSPVSLAVPLARERSLVKYPSGGASSWSFRKTNDSTADAHDFLSRCDDGGKIFFSALFEAQKVISDKTKITWKHQSGFSLQFYFHRIGFVPFVWGFPATNRDGRSSRERLDFPFDFSLKAGVPEVFISEFAASLSSLVPLLGGDKRPNISIPELSSADSGKIIDTIFRFAAKASRK